MGKINRSYVGMLCGSIGYPHQNDTEFDRLSLPPSKQSSPTGVWLRGRKGLKISPFLVCGRGTGDGSGGHTLVHRSFEEVRIGRKNSNSSDGLVGTGAC